MTQVRRDIGITDNEFTGNGISVGMIERYYTTANAQSELSNLTIHYDGTIAPAGNLHARDVARTFVGSNGIAPGVDALYSYGNDKDTTLAEEINWLLEPLRNVLIINISEGVNASNTGYEWRAAFIDYHTRNNNVTFVAAAGNSGMSNDHHTDSPAIGYNIIAVGASDANADINTYSSYGVSMNMKARKPTLVAPGTKLETTDFAKEGTSYASPVVAGVVARLMEEFPILQTRPDMVQAVLIASATPVNGHGNTDGQVDEIWDMHAGAGRVHYERAREAARNAIGFEIAAVDDVGQTRFTHTIDVVPNAKIKIAAHWQANSPTSSHTGANCAFYPDMHTNYDLRVKNTAGTTLVSGTDDTNIQVLWHYVTGGQYTIDIVQTALRHTENTKEDRGAIAWVYEPTEGLQFTAINSGTEYSVSKGTATDSCIIIPDLHAGLPVTAVAVNALKNFTGLLGVKIPSSVTMVGASAFENCINLAEAFLPAGVTSIGASALADCTSLTGVSLPSTITSIGSSAFQNCTSLTDFAMPSALTAIGASAFSGCGSLTSVNIPSGVTAISASAFSDCTSLAGVVLPSTITSIGASAFQNCTSLTDFTMPANLAAIYGYAFSGCSKLTSVTIPQSVTTIGSKAFEKCTKLQEINFNATNMPDLTLNSNVFYQPVSQFAGNPYWEITLRIGANVTRIPNYLFQTDGLTYSTAPRITEIIFESGSACGSIGMLAFAACTDLTRVVIPSGLTEIGAGAFYSCGGLAEVYYEGTSVAWNNITIGSSNGPLTSAAMYYHHNSPTQIGDYWDWDGDVPTQWRFITLDRNYSGGGSSLCPVLYGAHADKPNNPGRTGYTFDVWSLSAGSMQPYAFSDSGNSTPVTQNFTLYAKWTANQYTVSFSTDGINIDNTIAPITVTYGQQYGYHESLPYPTPPANHYLECWLTEPNGSGSYISDYSTVTAAGSHTLYARFSLNVYMVKFALNGGVNYTDFPMQSVEHGGTAEEPLDIPYRPDCVFLYWALDSDLTEEYDWYALVTDDITLVAVWQDNSYTVTLKWRDGTGRRDYVTAVYGAPMPYTAAPTRDGYYFGGYFDAKHGGGTKYYGAGMNSVQNYNTEGDITLYAYWIDAGSVVFWDGSVALGFAAGDGSESDPYQISNGAELAYLAQEVGSGSYWSWDLYFILTNNIYLNDTYDWENWGSYEDASDALNAGINSWTPIGTDDYYTYDKAFMGYFDGCGFAVFGIYINSDEDYRGLFGYSEGSIRNVIVVQSYIKGGSYVGGIAGYGYEIYGCVNAGNISGSLLYDEYDGPYYGFYIGGIAGSAYRIIDCHNSGNIDGNLYVGGIAGCGDEIYGCYNYGSISGAVWYDEYDGPYYGSYIGGIAGEANRIIDCHNYGEVNGILNDEGDGSYTGGACIGGIAGSAGRIIDCSNKGNVFGCINVGGIIGLMDGGVVNNSLNEGAVFGCTYVGGIAGRSLISSLIVIVNSTNTGDVTGDNFVGGIVGYITSGTGGSFSGGYIINCYNTGRISNYDNFDQWENYLGTPSPRIGGIVGRVGSYVTMINNYNAGEIWTYFGSYAGLGGLIGDIFGSNNTITYNWSLKTDYINQYFGLVGSGSYSSSNNGYFDEYGELLGSNGTYLCVVLNYYAGNFHILFASIKTGLLYYFGVYAINAWDWSVEHFPVHIPVYTYYNSSGSNSSGGGYLAGFYGGNSTFGNGYLSTLSGSNGASFGTSGTGTGNYLLTAGNTNYLMTTEDLLPPIEDYIAYLQYCLDEFVSSLPQDIPEGLLELLSDAQDYLTAFAEGRQ